MGRPFSRSYGTILPSSLTKVLSITSVCSTYPPVSVLVRVRSHSLEAFLGGMESATCRISPTDVPSQTLWLPDFPRNRPTGLSLVNQRQGLLILPRPPIGNNAEDAVQEYQPVVHRLRLTASA